MFTLRKTVSRMERNINFVDSDFATAFVNAFRKLTFAEESPSWF